MGDCSEEQTACLEEFKKWVTEEKFNEIGLWDDYDFLRFCRARKFVLDDVKLMWSNSM